MFNSTNDKTIYWDEKPFTRIQDGGLYNEDYVRFSHDLDKVTRHYGHFMPISRTPIFHPYHPDGDDVVNIRNHQGCVGTVVTVRCPKEVTPYLPETVLKVLKDNKISLDKVDVFFVTQNMPWKNQTLLFRPHYWVHGQTQNDDAIEKVIFNVDTPCRIGIFSPTNPNMNCDGKKDILSPNFVSVNSHAGKDKTGTYPMTICSPSGVGVLNSINFEQTDSAFSVVLTQDGRAAVTLHWFLNEVDQESLNKISRLTILGEDIKHFSIQERNKMINITPEKFAVKNLAEFIEAVFKLQNSRLNMKDGPLSQLKSLYEKLPNRRLEEERQKKALEEKRRQDQLEKEKKERERAEKEKKEKAERENQERLKKEKEEQLEKERQERERLEKEKKEREKFEREKQEGLLFSTRSEERKKLLLKGILENDFNTVEKAFRYLRDDEINYIPSGIEYGNCNMLQLALKNTPPHKEIVLKLINKGINLSHKNADSKTALDIILITSKNSEIEQILKVAQQERNNQLIETILKGSLLELNHALNAGANINSVCSGKFAKFNALQLAIFYEKKDIALKLLSMEGINLEHENHFRESTLEMAKNFGDEEIIQKVQDLYHKKNKV